MVVQMALLTAMQLKLLIMSKNNLIDSIREYTIRELNE